MDDINWTEMTQELFKFGAEGATIEGIYTGSTGVTTKYGDGIKHTIWQGDKAMVFFGTTILNDMLEQVAIGKVIRIKYLQEQDTGTGRKVKTFQLWVKKD